MSWNRNKQGKRPKYGNKKVTYEGHNFDSTKERDRYIDLKLMQRAGLISELELQPKWVLMPTTRIGGKTQRVTTYSADFSYVKDGVKVVEDVKSEATKTDVYKLKRKLMYVVHGIEVMEV